LSLPVLLLFVLFDYEIKPLAFDDWNFIEAMYYIVGWVFFVGNILFALLIPMPPKVEEEQLPNSNTVKKQLVLLEDKDKFKMTLSANDINTQEKEAKARRNEYNIVEEK